MTDKIELKPSPLVASVGPGERFDPEHHLAFGNIFLEKTMSLPNEEIESITMGAGIPAKRSLNKTGENHDKQLH